ALGQVADVLADLVGLRHHVVAGDLGHAAGGGQVAGEDAHGGRLAGAVGAEKAHDLAAADLEADAVDGQHGAEVLGEVLDADHAHGSCMGGRGETRRILSTYDGRGAWQVCPRKPLEPLMYGARGGDSRQLGSEARSRIRKNAGCAARILTNAATRK